MLYLAKGLFAAQLIKNPKLDNRFLKRTVFMK